MRPRTLRRLRSEAYTLIELLVVISIIAILASLTAAAIMKIISKPADVRVRSDMSQLDGAIQTYMTQMNASYIPSRLTLCYKSTSYTTSALDQESLAYITKTIGKSSPNFTNAWKNGIMWTPGINNVNGTVTLEGEQVLVFLLGGIQTQSGTQYVCNGFSPDTGNPATPPTPGTGLGPFYSFDPNRLSLPPNAAYFPAYQDAYGPRLSDNQPRFYAFFSSYKSQNGYNRYTSAGALATSPSLASSDCASLGGVWPYASQAATGSGLPQYENSKTWQIICSGLDGTFGPGTNFSIATGTPYYWNKGTAAQIPTGGADDYANFAAGKLQFGE